MPGRLAGRLAGCLDSLPVKTLGCCRIGLVTKEEERWGKGQRAKGTEELARGSRVCLRS